MELGPAFILFEFAYDLELFFGQHICCQNVLSALKFCKEEMGAGVVKLISFAKEKNNFSTKFKGVFEVDKMVQEVTNGVENDVLCQSFWNSHCCLFLWFFFNCDGSLLSPCFECFSKIVADAGGALCNTQSVVFKSVFVFILTFFLGLFFLD